MSDQRTIIKADDDPFAERTYTLTVTSAEAIAIRDAVTCMWSLQQGHDVEDYRDPPFMEEAHAVADRLTEMQRPEAMKLGKHIRMVRDSIDRRN